MYGPVFVVTGPCQTVFLVGVSNEWLAASDARVEASAFKGSLNGVDRDQLFLFFRPQRLELTEAKPAVLAGCHKFLERCLLLWAEDLRSSMAFFRTGCPG